MTQNETSTSQPDTIRSVHHIRRRVLLALAVLLVPLIGASGAAIFLHHESADTARYSMVLGNLVENVAQLEGHVAKLEAGRNVDPALAKATFVETIGLYGALRAADPDGDEILEAGEAPQREALAELTTQLGGNPVERSNELGLLGHEMPEELVQIWEEEGSWSLSDELSPSLEATIGSILLSGAAVFVEGKQDLASIEQFWSAIDVLSSEQISAVISELQAIAVKSGQAPELLTVAVLGIVLVAALLAWFGIVRPLIRQTVRVQMDLKREAAAARAADLAKTQFLATISHELRTPMNGIIGAAQLLSHSDLDEDDKEMVDILVSCADGQMALIDEILTFGEVEAGALRMIKEPVNVAQLIQDATSFATVMAQNKGLDLDVSVSDDLPDILGDHKRLRQVLVNLVGNAVKFTETGGVSVQAVLDRSEITQDVTLRVFVSDTGPGIAEQHRAQIFERFTQGDSSSSRKAGGTGLGLAIAMGIVREAKGDITLDSELGTGSTFALILPTQIAPSAEDNTHTEKDAA